MVTYKDLRELSNTPSSPRSSSAASPFSDYRLRQFQTINNELTNVRINKLFLNSEGLSNELQEPGEYTDNSLKNSSLYEVNGSSIQHSNILEYSDLFFNENSNTDILTKDIIAEIGDQQDLTQYSNEHLNVCTPNDTNYAHAEDESPLLPIKKRKLGLNSSPILPHPSNLPFPASRNSAGLPIRRNSTPEKNDTSLATPKVVRFHSKSSVDLNFPNLNFKRRKL